MSSTTASSSPRQMPTFCWTRIARSSPLPRRLLAATLPPKKTASSRACPASHHRSHPAASPPPSASPPAPSAWAPTPPHSPPPSPRASASCPPAPRTATSTKSPRTPSASPTPSRSASRRSRPPSIAQFDPTYKPHAATPALRRRHQLGAGHGLLPLAHQKTGKPWRLPTEAEWEYVARAGGTKIFGASDTPIPLDQPNAFGVENMGVGRPEWTLDGTRPTNPASRPIPSAPHPAMTKAIRGGGLDWRHTANEDLTRPQRPRHRALLLARRQPRQPAHRPTPPKTATSASASCRRPMPDQPTPRPPQSYFFETAVHQLTITGAPALSKPIDHPDAQKPFYRTHELFPNLAGKSMPDVGWRLGLAPGLGINYHNSAIQVLPNGDLLAAYYNTPDSEDDPDQTVMVLRRRAGTEDWDMPEPFPLFADAGLAAPVIWNDPKFQSQPGGRIWFFWGFARLIGAPPFAFATSTDNGATWSAAQFPVLPRAHRPLRLAAHQLHRPRQGRHHLHAHRLHRPRLRRQRLHLRRLEVHRRRPTWSDTGGRTAGRHTTIVFAQRTATSSASAARTPTSTAACPSPPPRRRQDLDQIQDSPSIPLASGERPSVIRLARRQTLLRRRLQSDERETHPQGRRLRRALLRRRQDLDHQAPSLQHPHRRLHHRHPGPRRHHPHRHHQEHRQLRDRTQRSLAAR